MNNPFTLSFGKKPLQYISRISQTTVILENFKADIPSSQIYMLTGVRGSGKTVLMTTITNTLRKESDWVVLELNPARDLLQSMAAKLYGLPEMHQYFLKAKIDVSILGLGVSVEGFAPVTDIEQVLELMLTYLKKQNKKVLITIDEVVNSEHVKIFMNSFQIFLRQNQPVYLLMTGLYDNIYDLQNEQTLTFLYRAPKVILEPLNYSAIRKQYMDIFDIDAQQAADMAALTKGYPFAFQVLGYLCWENRDKKSIKEILPEYDQYLEEYVYSKIWSELSEWDKKILAEMSFTGETKVKMIRERLGMGPEKFSVYRERLRRKGVVDTSQYGRLSLILPRFDEFVKLQLL